HLPLHPFPTRRSSDLAPPTPGWWLASDGNWYPPEAAPGVTPAAPSYGPPPVTYGPSNTPYGYTPYQQTRGTNGFAIASMVLGIVDRKSTRLNSSHRTI